MCTVSVCRERKKKNDFVAVLGLLLKGYSNIRTVKNFLYGMVVKDRPARPGRVQQVGTYNTLGISICECSLLTHIGGTLQKMILFGF